MEQYVLAVVAMANLALGLIVLARNPSFKSSRSFAAMTLAVFFWCVGLVMFYSATTHQDILLATRWFYIAALWMNTFLLLFTIFFCQMEKLKRLIALPVFLSTLMTIYISFSEKFFIDSIFIAEGNVNVDLSNGSYLVYVSLIMGYYIVNLAAFGGTYKASRGLDRSKIWFMLLGFSFAGVFASYFNVYLPLLGNYALIWIGPIFTLLFVALFTYAILRFKLFDIRVVAVKTIAYVLTLLVLVAAPVAGVSFLFDSWVAALSQAYRAFVVTGFYALVLVTFGPAKRMVDRATSRVFYRDAYDSQEVIDVITNITVTEYEIDELIRDVTKEIADAIKPANGCFILLDANGEYYGDYPIGNRIDGFEIHEAIPSLADQQPQLFAADVFESTSDVETANGEHLPLYEYMRAQDISMSVKLSTRDEVVAHMLFGGKLSGNLYSEQDKDFLAIVANEMSVAIQNARRFDEIKRFNETLTLEVDRATKELRNSNEKLQALDEAKNEFISMASHQLRTPLTSVKGYLSMVLEGDAGKVDEKQRDLLAAAFTSSQRMVYLIADLLNVSRLQTGKFVIEPVVTNLVSVVEGEIDQLKETAKAKKLKVKFKKPKDFPDVYIDETKIRQVIMNFIDNAIYYTPQGGEIVINLHADSKKIEYTVDDNGIGVPKSEQRNLFSKFYRASNAKKARPDGTGLGLFMAKKVIVDQGGAIIFHSKEGHGSTFGFTFPLTRVRPPKRLSKKSDEETKKSPRKKSK